MNFFRVSALVVCLLGAVLATSGWADEPASRSRAESLEQRIEQVTPDWKEPSPLTLEVLGMSATLSGLLEVELFEEHPEGGDAHGEVTLSTVQLGLDIDFSRQLSGHLVALWEEDDTEPAEIDEAVMALHLYETLWGKTPFLYVGRQYLPFGMYSSGMVSDPLTLELGETRRTSAVFGVESEPWTVRFGVFDDYTAPDGDDQQLESWVAAVEMTPSENVSFGASWLNDLAESGAGLVQDESLYGDSVPAVSAFVNVQCGQLGLGVEYVTAVEDFDRALLADGEDLTGQRPAAWNLELSWSVSERIELAARYEGAKDYQADLSRYGITGAYGLCDYAMLALEYLHSDAQGEDGDPVHLWTAQLAVEF